MLTLDFLPPDPGLVDRIRQGLDAHKAQTGMRERLAGAATPPAPPAGVNDACPAAPRQAPPSPPRHANG